ncbi:MAG: hypothetical protein KDA32_14200 [Phycisphaerales bacterium]|nr:hypothetical protein [Phycisphaerales bacterium]
MADTAKPTARSVFDARRADIARLCLRLFRRQVRDMHRRVRQTKLPGRLPARVSASGGNGAV